MEEDLKQYFENYDFNGESNCNIRSVFFKINHLWHRTRRN